MTNHPPFVAHPLVDSHTMEFTTTSKVIDEIKQASGDTDSLVLTSISTPRTSFAYRCLIPRLRRNPACLQDMWDEDPFPAVLLR